MSWILRSMQHFPKPENLNAENYIGKENLGFYCFFRTWFGGEGKTDFYEAIKAFPLDRTSERKITSKVMLSILTK